MKLFILLFGLLAALLGVLGSAAALAFQLQAIASGARDGVDAVIFAALALSAVGLLGARMALRYPCLSSAVMATAAVGGLLATTWFYLVPAMLFSVASALSFLWRNEAAPSLKLD